MRLALQAPDPLFETLQLEALSIGSSSLVRRGRSGSRSRARARMMDRGADTLLLVFFGVEAIRAADEHVPALLAHRAALPAARAHGHGNAVRGAAVVARGRERGLGVVVEGVADTAALVGGSAGSSARVSGGAGGPEGSRATGSGGAFAVGGVVVCLRPCPGEFGEGVEGGEGGDEGAEEDVDDGQGGVLGESPWKRRFR